MGNCCSNSVDFNGEPSLYHFNLHRPIGKGAFGKVRVVEHKKTHKLYALKYINKVQAVKENSAANVIQERRLLEEVDHPFVCNLRYAFQDDENCFFVLDLMLGGDLRFHLDRRGPIPEPVVRVWVAELSSAVEYLHRQRIIHRDIKPDNIMLDADGHAHLTDFNVAMHYDPTRLHTSCGGSMAYMAPEMIFARMPTSSSTTASSRSGRDRSLGYTWCVDWWSLGVTAFELAYKRRPFEAKSPEKLKEHILYERIRYEACEGKTVDLSRECMSVIQGLLERDPRRRLGCRPDGQGIADIRAHAWFRGIDWQKLEAKELEPAFVPDAKRPNFDVAHELDEFLMLEKPLTYNKRTENPNLEKMNPDRQMLETKFTPYDHHAGPRLSYFPAGQAPNGAAPAQHLPSCPHSASRSHTTTRSGATRTSPSPSPSARSRETTGSVRTASTAVHSTSSLAPSASTAHEQRSYAGTPVPMPADPRLQRIPAPLPPSLRRP